MGKVSLGENEDFLSLKEWSISQGLTKLEYFSLWEDYGK